MSDATIRLILDQIGPIIHYIRKKKKILDQIHLSKMFSVKDGCTFM